ncbi:hypothetical protein PoB_001928100 [Plakobranchus ocellatus]|uniref:Uncharacterized protein n=1 Tax=Plakobranchus ocellatus TaxID=259542 RepID=A0AAV3ZA15_9GAST|nr:hypothetical protein PoB_001928100 [Plakobranchus ocellatus]
MKHTAVHTMVVSGFQVLHQARAPIASLHTRQKCTTCSSKDPEIPNVVSIRKARLENSVLIKDKKQNIEGAVVDLMPLDLPSPNLPPYPLKRLELRLPLRPSRRNLRNLITHGAFLMGCFRDPPPPRLDPLVVGSLSPVSSLITHPFDFAPRCSV